MGIRPEAMNSKAFARLLDVYQNRDAEVLKWKEKGSKVVGMLGADVPEEVIIAAGMLPVQVYADPDKELAITDVFLEQAFEPTARATFEKIVDGTYDELLDYLVVSHTGDNQLRLWLYLREMLRSEPDMRIPPVEFVDWLLVPRRIYQEENKNVVRRFVDAVEGWIGHKITDKEMRIAFEVCNRQREALRELAALRHDGTPRITGCEALVVIGAGFFMDRSEHTVLVHDVVVDALSWPEVPGPRIYVTGSNQESLDLYEAIERTGAVVVGEDFNWGDRSYNRDTRCDIDPIAAIVDRYMLRRCSCNRSLVAQRVAVLDEEVNEANAQGVIFFMNEHDEAGSWDVPEQRKSLAARGIGALELCRQKWPLSKNEGLEERLVGFVSELEEDAR